MSRWPILLLAMACTPGDEAGPRQVLTPHGAVDLIEGIERLTEGDGFKHGVVEEWQALLTDPAARVRWSASGGSLAADGARAAWTLPEVGDTAWIEVVAELPDAEPVRQRYDIQLIAVSPNAAGQIDPADEEAGSQCDVAIDANDVPHVVYRNDWHAQWKYAKFQGGQWQLELIDGPGFGVGGLAAYTPPSIVLDANNVPHVALARQDGTVAYATRSGGAWTVTEIASDNSTYPVSIVLDGSTPYIVHYDNAASQLVMRKKNAGNWASFNWTFPGGWGYPSGGLANVGNATLKFTWQNDYSNVAQWTQAGGFTSNNQAGYIGCCGARRVDLVAVSGGVEGVLTESNLRWSTNNGTNFDTHGVLESDSDNDGGLTWDGAGPRMAINHSGVLETIRPDARGYWAYTAVDTGISHSSDVQVALDTSNNLHGCYQKTGRIYFF